MSESQPGNTQGTPPSRSELESTKYRRGEFQLLILQVVFDLLIFLVTGIYAFFAYNQWQAMESQATAMRGQLTAMQEQLTTMQDQANSMREGLRPYIVSQVWLTKFDGQEMEVKLVLVTGGSSPAKDVTINYGFVIGDAASSTCSDFESRGRKSGPFTILPEQQYPIVIRSTLSGPEIEATRSRTSSLFFCGKGSFSGIGGNYPIQVCGEYIQEFKSFSECPK